MNFIKTSILITLSSLFISCAHHKDVRPNASGEHTVLVKAETQELGSREALNQANAYCKTMDKSAFIVSEGKEYNGELDEETYKNTQKLKEAAGILFSGTQNGHKAKKAASTYLGSAYSIKMIFNCK